MEHHKSSSAMDFSNSTATMSTEDSPITSASEVSAISNSSTQIDYGYLKVSVEPLRRKQTPAQCYNCQEFYHHSRLCTRKARCLKYGDSHSTNNCTKPKDTPAKCCLCGGPHTANHSQCPKNPAMRRTFQAAPSDGWNNANALARVNENFPTQQPVATIKSPIVQPKMEQPQDKNQPITENQITNLMNNFLSQMSAILKSVPAHVQ
ncbi:Nucleic-acid-binding protein transposon like protein [Argiope bruennichi]|uniref:Nucleic-acid-binding protein transposon like protein n=1 Tax=Argiope bruennichi TaxID=94029 RepID=A0A8T0FEH6_ARGBR|nr:Nucleic-acid-binding protein transposon like protein [Argiope bruennichi]